MNKLFIKSKTVLMALLSVIVAFCGVISLAPTSVYAEGGANANVSASALSGSIDLSDAEWNVDGKVFDGKPFAYDGRSKDFTLGDYDELIYAYYGANDVKLDKAPKDVGNYYVEVVAPEGVELTGEYEQRKDFIIEKATLVNPSASFERELDIVRGKWIVKATPSTSNFYGDAVVTGALEAGLKGTYEIRLEFALIDKNFKFDESKLQNTNYKCEITDNGDKFVITYSWTIDENVERSFKNTQNYTAITDENNTLPEGIEEADFKVSMEEVDLNDYTDILKEQYADKRVRFGAAYDIFFADDSNEPIEITNGSKFMITVPVAANLTESEKDDIKIMFIKEDGNIEFLSITDFVDEAWGEEKAQTTVRSIEFETSDLGRFVVIGLKQLPEKVGDWWQYAFIAVLAIAVVLAIVFIALKPKKNNDTRNKRKSESENGEYDNE